MNKFKKSQVLVFFVLLLLLAITPLLPSSLRTTYLYFISNIIIITLGAEAGLFTAISKPLEEIKHFVSVIQKPLIPSEAYSEIPSEAYSEEREASTTEALSTVSDHVEKKVTLVENSTSERVVSVTKVDKVLQKGPSSSASLFFIGNEEADANIMDEETEAEEENGEVNRKELFAKAEAFIGNFYKQLKTQREESRVYQKAF